MVNPSTCELPEETGWAPGCWQVQAARALKALTTIVSPGLAIVALATVVCATATSPVWNGPAPRGVCVVFASSAVSVTGPAVRVAITAASLETQGESCGFATSGSNTGEVGN